MPGGVRADQRRLQLGRALGRDHRVGQRAEPGRHAVHRLGLVDQPLDDGGAALERRTGVVAELDPPAVAGDGDDVGGGDAVGPSTSGVVARRTGRPVRARPTLSGA